MEMFCFKIIEGFNFCRDDRSAVTLDTCVEELFNFTEFESHNTSVFLNFLYVDNFVEFASSVAFFYVMQVGGCQSQLEDLVQWAW